MFSAFSPGQITGFFKLHYSKNFLFSGSTGAGICISNGVETSVKLKSSQKTKFKIQINNQLTNDAIVSKFVARTMTSKLNQHYEISIKHYSDMPIGCGYGSSGSAALSLAYALNEALSLGLSQEKTAQIAHIAEIKCRTGLGTVLSLYNGGAHLRLNPGAPGIGKVLKFNSNNRIIATFTLGNISTQDILLNPAVPSFVNNLGQTLIQKFTNNPSVDLFLTLSRYFALSLNFFPYNLYQFMKLADRYDIVCSMNMFGYSIFSIIKSNEKAEFYNLFRKSNIKGKLIFSNIDNIGAHLL